LRPFKQAKPKQWHISSRSRERGKARLEGISKFIGEQTGGMQAPRQALLDLRERLVEIGGLIAADDRDGIAIDLGGRVGG
jgi:hypothetical protein